MRTATAWSSLILVLLGCALPVMLWLGEPEMRSDEAIYSYAVERMLDTGEWLTPRSIQGDGPFLEKPPLKLWLVAAVLRAGLVPRDEGGLRVVDALFGAISFIYIYLFGRRLGGAVCGVVAALTVFTLDPLVFHHGLRSNNMEAAMVLCYAGGLFHLACWADPQGRQSTSVHAYAVAAYFTLGFMSKFVGAAFLPMIAVAALLWRRGGAARLRERWRDWLAPAALVVAFSAPWFVYESWEYGSQFWQIIFGAHVFQRFTASLDPTHLHPWYFYFFETWNEVGYTGAQILVVAGAARLVLLAWRGEVWVARLALLWALLPLALISLGTSKLLHYAYPFWPPIGLAAGLAATWGIETIRERGARSLRTRASARWAVLGAAGVLVGMAAWTAMVGSIHLNIGGVPVFTSSSVLRPAILAAVLLALADVPRTWLQLAGVFLVVVTLPLHAYEDKLHRLGQVDHPLRQMRDCMTAVRASGAPSGAGVFVASGDVLAHGYYYYLWRTGPWMVAPVFDADAVLQRLAPTGHETPVVLRRSEADALEVRLPVGTAAIGFEDNMVALLSGSYSRCAPGMIAAGGFDIRARAGGLPAR
jgi:4-amino-4-deoxy-L-arabinose transferase-like glycosyltransferase